MYQSAYSDTSGDEKEKEREKLNPKEDSLDTKIRRFSKFDLRVGRAVDCRPCQRRYLIKIHLGKEKFIKIM